MWYENLYLLAILAIDVQAECRCIVPYSGIYLGMEINQYATKQICELNLFYCRKFNSKPQVLVNCSTTPGCFYQPKLFNCKCSNRQVKKQATFCGKIYHSGCIRNFLYLCLDTKPELIGFC